MGDTTKLEEYIMDIIQRLARVEQKLDTHIESHKTSVNVVPVWAGVLVAIGLGVINII